MCSCSSGQLLLAVPEEILNRNTPTTTGMILFCIFTHLRLMHLTLLSSKVFQIQREKGLSCAHLTLQGPRALLRRRSLLSVTAKGAQVSAWSCTPAMMPLFLQGHAPKTGTDSQDSLGRAQESNQVCFLTL